MNYELIAQWSEVIGGFAFVIVAIALFRKYVLPAVRSGEVARNADLVNAERRREELRVEVAKARAAIEDADRNAVSIAARAQADAEHERHTIISAGRAEAARLVENARGELDRSRIGARDRLRIEFIEKALVRARELASAAMTDEVNARLVERTVDGVTAGKGN